MANQLIDRVADFNERFEKFGDGLDALQRQYDEARKKLNTGRQSLLGPARQLVELGAKENPKRPLPPAEEAEL